MDQVRIYLLTLRKQPSRGKGYFGRRLEEITQPHVIRFNTTYMWPERARMTDRLQRMKMENA